jgi:hypothetical protein
MPKGYPPSHNERAAPSFSTDPHERDKTIWLRELVSQANYLASGVDDAVESKKLLDQLERLRQAQRGRNGRVRRPVMVTRIGVRSITLGLLLAISTTSFLLYSSVRPVSRLSQTSRSKPTYDIASNAVAAISSPRPLAPVSKAHRSDTSSFEAQTTSDRADIGQLDRAPPKEPYAATIASTAFPPQPVPTPPKALLDWSKSWQQGTPSAPPHAVIVGPAPVVAAKPVRLLPVPPHPSMPTPLGRSEVATAIPTVDALPEGTALHVYVNYSSKIPDEVSQATAILRKLQSQAVDVVSRDNHTQPFQEGSVTYFFSDDSGGAKLVAQKVKDLTGHDAAIKLMKQAPLPRPGTVEVNL